MSIPTSLMYFSEAMAGLSRNNIAIQSQSGTSMATDGTQMIRFSFPSASIVDLASFAISADCEVVGKAATGTNDSVVALMPSGGLRAMIGRCAFSCGGISLSNDVSPLDVIARCRDNLECSMSKACSDKRVLEAYQIRGVNATDPPTAPVNGVGGYGQKRKCVATNIPGFCGSAVPRYFDCSVAPQIFCQVSLAGRQNIPVQYQTGATTWDALGDSTNRPASFAGTECNFRATNIEASIDVISLATGLYSQMVQDLMAERGALTIPFFSYNTWSSTGGATATVRGALSTSNLHKIYGVARLAQDIGAGRWEGERYNAQKKWTTQQVPVMMQDNIGIAGVQASHSFCGLGLKTFRWRVNNAPFSLHDVGPLGAYLQAANGEDRLRESQPGSLVSSLRSWYASQFALTNRFSLDNLVSRLSGLSLAALSASLSLDCTGDGSAEAAYNRDYTIFTVSTSRLMIAPGRAVSVVH